MNRAKLAAVFLVTLVCFVALVVHAESDQKTRPGKIKPKGPAEIQRAPTSLPQISPQTGSRQGYQLVTDVLDGFGGESESDNYRIPVNSGGQPSAIGLSGSGSWGVQAGYVLAIRVIRGDVNADGIINVGDIVYLVSYLYKGGPQPCPVEAGDVTLDRIVNVGDIVYLVSYLYKGGPPPAC
jgi:hypothetical protein